MPNYKLVDKVTRAKNAGGVLWAGPIHVLCRYGDRELWRVPGVTHNGRCGSSTYIPCSLDLVELAGAHWSQYRGKSKTLQDGGRLSKALFLKFKTEINNFFFCDVADKLDPKKTLLLED